MKMSNNRRRERERKREEREEKLLICLNKEKWRECMFIYGGDVFPSRDRVKQQIQKRPAVCVCQLFMLFIYSHLFSLSLYI